jgi:hypothetical protein
MLLRDDLLGIAKKHVEQGRERVDRQRKVVKNLNLNGLDTGFSEDVLRMFERLQSKFEEDHARLSRKDAWRFPPQGLRLFSDWQIGPDPVIDRRPLLRTQATQIIDHP